MSEKHLKLLKQTHAAQRYERNWQLLQLELRMGTARRHLDVLVELLERLVVDMGDHIGAAKCSADLQAAKLKVTARGNLRAVSS